MQKNLNMKQNSHCEKNNFHGFTGDRSHFQLYSGSMILGGLVGFAILQAFLNGKMQMMCSYKVCGTSRLYYDLCCGFCISHDGDINQLVKGVVEIIGDNRLLS